MFKPCIGPNVDCTACPGLVRSRVIYDYKKPTWGYGSKISQLIFIGEAPGRNGCGRTGIPFNGDPSGDYYQECLAAAGLTLDDVYTTNAVKCCPPANRTPTLVERVECSQRWLEKELAEVEGKIIVPLGRTALESFITFPTSMSSIVGTAFKFEKYIVVPYYHPAYALRLGKPAWYKEGLKRIISCQAIRTARLPEEIALESQREASSGQKETQ